MKIIDLKDIENILSEVFNLKKLPKKIKELEQGDFKEWDSLGNFNLLIAIEEFYSVRFNSKEIINIRSVKQILYALNNKLK
jgi:acyl carrier protein